MATLLKRKSKKTGRWLWTVQVVLSPRRRPSVPLGSITKAQAQQAKGYIESLASTRRGNLAMPGTTADWLGGLDDDFYDLLVSRGLCDPRQEPKPTPEPNVPTLAAFIDSYIDGRTDVKRGTVIWYQQTRRCLVAYFGAEKPLNAITAGDAKDFRRWLTRPKDKDNPKAGGQGLNENTTRKRCAIAKQMFTDAVDRELFERNPFGKMEGLTVGASEGRDYFITRDEAQAVLDACPDTQWKLLFALSRYGGLRCPSEHLALRWGDIDWERGRIVIRSPKTEHHEGKGERVIPLWPELRPYLEKVWDEAPEKTEFVIARYRDTNANLRTQLRRIIAKAKLTPWPKLFQNLRSTRATELAAEFPAHVAAEWMGHSTAVADKHYWRVTDADFERAVRAANALQSPTETGNSSGNEQKAEREKSIDVRIAATLSENPVLPVGLEPTTY